MLCSYRIQKNTNYNGKQKLTVVFCTPLTLPPCEDSEFANGVTGSEDALLILGVNIFESDRDLDIEGFSRCVVNEESEAMLAALSTSKVQFRDLKLSFGKRFFNDDFPLEEEPGDPIALPSIELGVSRKFTFLGVGVCVGGIFITTESCKDSSIVFDGISKMRCPRFQLRP